VLAGLARAEGRSVGHSYAVESAGAAAAGAGVTLAMGLGASTFQVAVVAPALGVLAALAAAAQWPRRRRLGFALLVLFAVAVPVARAKPWDLALLGRMYPALIDAVDTPYARIAISRRDSQVAVFANGALAFDTEGTSAEAFADLAGLQHRNPGAPWSSAGEAKGSPPRSVATASR